MRTVFLSDLHVDINEAHEVAGEFAAYLKRRGASLAVIAGDISESQDLTLETLERIEEESGVEVLFVPGNHDLWSPKESPEKIEEIYARYCEDRHCLCGRDGVYGDLVFLGDVGWYDYSFGAPKYSKEEFDRMEISGRIWQDSLRNPGWTEDNVGRSQWMLDRLEARMKAHPGKRLVMVTHMLPIKEFTVPPQRGDWGYFNGFLGSQKLGELYSGYPVEVAVCGHVHYRKTLERQGVQWLCRCLNYESEWRPEEGNTCARQIEKAAEVLEL